MCWCSCGGDTFSFLSYQERNVIGSFEGGYGDTKLNVSASSALENTFDKASYRKLLVSIKNIIVGKNSAGCFISVILLVACSIGTLSPSAMNNPLID